MRSESTMAVARKRVGGEAAPTPTSDLARLCLQPDREDRHRHLAWAISVCLAFLSVGLLGVRSRPLEQKPVATITEVVPVVFLPPAVAASTAVEPVSEGPPEAGVEPVPEVPVVATVVAEDLGEVLFPAPMEGLMVKAPARRADPGPAAAMPVRPGVFDASAAAGGSFPPPPYPAEALRREVQGTVTLSVVVDDRGRLDRVDLRDSSGSALLDRHSVQWVTHRWRFPAGSARHYYVPIVYQLK